MVALISITSVAADGATATATGDVVAGVAAAGDVADGVGASRGPLVRWVVGGTMKGGTTHLDRVLRSHPELRLSTNGDKELHFFDLDVPTHRGASPKTWNWSNPDYDLYHQCWQTSGPNQTKMDVYSSGPKAVGEVTPIYMYLPAAIERMHRYNPAMKWILLFRHPIARAFSHWRHSMCVTETLPFSDSIRVGWRHERNMSLDATSLNGLEWCALQQIRLRQRVYRLIHGHSPEIRRHPSTDPRYTRPPQPASPWTRPPRLRQSPPSPPSHRRLLSNPIHPSDVNEIHQRAAPAVPQHRRISDPQQLQSRLARILSLNDTGMSASDRRYNYVERSLYGQQIQHLLTKFARNQILFVYSDDLRSKPVRTLERITQFLGVSPFPTKHMPKVQPNERSPTTWLSRGDIDYLNQQFMDDMILTSHVTRGLIRFHPLNSSLAVPNPSPTHSSAPLHPSHTLPATATTVDNSQHPAVLPIVPSSSIIHSGPILDSDDDDNDEVDDRTISSINNLVPHSSTKIVQRASILDSDDTN